MTFAPSKRYATHPPSDRPSFEERGRRDEVLLCIFLGDDEQESEDAFRQLVARHGPMVLGVCRHVLNQDQDAEDAFQATFLLLARKARTIRDHRVLSGWLYEVAYRIAIRARANTAKQRLKEREGVAMKATSAPSEHENVAAWNELRPVLHDEVNRLPEKYRHPVILSYLEGKSNEEVAELLNWPVGTVKGRLSRARDLLRSRLMRRGLVLSAAFLMTALARNTVFAEIVSEPLITRTTAQAMAWRRSGAALGSLATSASTSAEQVGTQRISNAANLARAAARRLLAGRSAEPRDLLFVALAAVCLALALAIVSDPVLQAQSAFYLRTLIQRSGCEEPTTVAAEQLESSDRGLIPEATSPPVATSPYLPSR